MNDRPSTDVGLVPLAERYRWTALLRVAVIAVCVLLWYLWPEARTGGGEQLAVPALVMLGLVVLSSQAYRLGRRAVLTGMTVGLLLDGCWLAWMFHLLSGVEGPIGYVVVSHVMAVTLLSSFRSGLKVAVWHLLLLITVIEAEAVGVIAGVPDAPFPTVPFGVLAAAVAAAAIGTSTFAAGNERELRRRRYDAEVLRGFASSLEQAVETEAVAHHLVAFAQQHLLAERAFVIVLPPVTEPVTGSAERGATGVAVGSDGVVHSVPGDFPVGSVAAVALGERRTQLVRQLARDPDRWVRALMPETRNVVVVPFSSDQEARGVLIMELGAQADPSASAVWFGAGSEPRVDRRAVATAEQATAHAGLAFGRTTLIGRLQAAADLDGLTGIANRRAFDAMLERESRAAAVGGAPYSLAVVDLDHFKQLNDQHGHQAGDDALRAAARALADACRPHDLPARFGGEEFVVILRNTDAGDAVVVAERLRLAVAECDSPVPVTASIGVASSLEVDADGATLLRAADQALYAAKQGGRNQVFDARELALADEMVR